MGKDNLPLYTMSIGQSIAAILPQLKQAAFRIARGQAHYEDMMQDTILAVIEYDSPGANDAAKASNTMFAYMITAMIRANMNYKKGLRTVSLHDTTEVEDLSLNIDLSARQDNELIDFAINFLGEPDRQIFLLYAFIDFDFEKVSKESGIPVQTIYTSVHRSKTKLRQWVIRR